MSAGLRPLEYLLLRRGWGSTSGAVNPGPSPRLRQVLQPQAKRSRLSAPKRDTLYIRLRDWVWGGRKPPSLRPSPLPPRPRRSGGCSLSPRREEGAGLRGPLTGRGATAPCAQARPAASIHSAPSTGARCYSRAFFFFPHFFKSVGEGKGS